MKFYQIDSFTDKCFSGNPAAVCLVYDKWPTEQLMQNIAEENNLSETAFVLNKNSEYFIRWFTPTTEVSICGHATLAAAHALFKHQGFCSKEIIFNSKNHILKVTNDGDFLVLDFPLDKIWRLEPDVSLDCFNFKPLEYWRGTEEYMLIFESEEQIQKACCDLDKAAKIDLSGIIITAKAKKPSCDFVSRYFGPKIGINEDPVTGSAHTLLAAYWQKILAKDELNARQLSKRGGELFCVVLGGRVKIAGKAITFLSGEIMI